MVSYVVVHAFICTRMWVLVHSISSFCFIELFVHETFRLLLKWNYNALDINYECKLCSSTGHFENQLTFV